MILADKIIDLRKKNGWSQEELAEKLGVSRQAVSKWESAQAIPDLGRVLMADLFSVTTDYSCATRTKRRPCGGEDGASDSNVRRVSMEEATPSSLCRKQAPTRALAVSLCAFTDSAADDSLPHGRRTCGGRGQHHRR
ncbi:MAG: helix-turn-helix transcriptional regulator [Christensenellales bacterium]